MSEASKSYIDLLSEYGLDEAWKIGVMGLLCEYSPNDGWIVGERRLASVACLKYREAGCYAVNSVFGVDPDTGFLLTLTASGPPTPIASAADWRGGVLLTKQNSFDLWRDTRQERIQRERLERAGAAGAPITDPAPAMMINVRRPCASGRPSYDSVPMGLPVSNWHMNSPVLRVAIHAAR